MSVPPLAANSCASGAFAQLPAGAGNPIGHVARLIALALGIAPDMRGSGRDALRRAKFIRVLRYIETHLAEPGVLTPRAVSEKLGMSVRSLHLLFEIEGVSFGHWVTRRRLEEIKSLLANPSAADRTIADIAFAWGFNDLSTFYGAFHIAYGVKPGDIRPSPTKFGA